MDRAEQLRNLIQSLVDQLNATEDEQERANLTADIDSLDYELEVLERQDDE